MTPAGFLAHSALGAARDLERTAAEVADKRDVVVELFAARRHLRYVGNNVNQVSKVLNSGAEATQTGRILEMADQAVRRVDEAVRQLIGLRTMRSR